MEIWENIKQSKGILIVAAVLVFLLLGAVALLLGENSKGKVKIVTQDSYSADGIDFVPPADKPMVKDYYYSREPKEKWTREDSEPWFTDPEGELLEKLENANKHTIDSIIGAAP